MRAEFADNGSGACWEATYWFPPALKNVRAEFEDRADRRGEI